MPHSIKIKPRLLNSYRTLFSLSRFSNINCPGKPLIPIAHLALKGFFFFLFFFFFSFPFNQCNQRKPRVTLTLRYQKLSPRFMTGWLVCVQQGMQMGAWAGLVPRWPTPSCFVFQWSPYPALGLFHINMEYSGFSSNSGRCDSPWPSAPLPHT